MPICLTTLNLYSAVSIYLQSLVQEQFFPLQDFAADFAPSLENLTQVKR